MQLRNGKLTKEYNKPSSRKHISRMTIPDNPNIDEIPSRTLTTTNPVVSQVAPFPPVGSTAAGSAQISQAPPGSPRPVMTTTTIPNVPRFGNVDPIYGMLYSMIPGWIL